MAGYLDRYLAGEHEKVWAELLAVGSAVREEPLYSEAQLVALETMYRVNENIKILLQRLDYLNYQFIYYKAYELPTQKDLTNLAQIEQMVAGPLPLSLRAWYAYIGGITFLGRDRDYEKWHGGGDCYHTATGECIDKNTEISPMQLLLQSSQFPPDPMVIFSTEDTLNHLLNLSDDGEDIINNGQYLISTETFTGDDTIIKIPDPAIDVPLQGDKRWAGFTFVGYLRENIRWGGFPGLKISPNPPKEFLDFLTKDLIPF